MKGNWKNTLGLIATLITLFGFITGIFSLKQCQSSHLFPLGDQELSSQKNTNPMLKESDTIKNITVLPSKSQADTSIVLDDKGFVWLINNGNKSFLFRANDFSYIREAKLSPDKKRICILEHDPDRQTYEITVAYIDYSYQQNYKLSMDGGSPHAKNLLWLTNSEVKIYIENFYKINNQSFNCHLDNFPIHSPGNYKIKIDKQNTLLLVNKF